MRFRDLREYGKASTIECRREVGLMVVNEGACKFIFGEGNFKRDDAAIRGWDQTCELVTGSSSKEEKEGQDTNDHQCLIECD